jgi:hypothetical protein
VDLTWWGAPLMDATKDYAWFLQLGTSTTGSGLPYLSLQRWAQVSWTHPDQQTAAISPALSSAGTQLSTTVNFKRSAW